MSSDGRFAPSPTGPLHVGSLRTALVAWLFARSQGGRFLVRIEDLDRQRSRRELERGQLEDLRALGIESDEPPVRQSERGALYARALERLEAAEQLYPCFCSRADIRAAASAPHGDRAAGSYPGTCRSLSAAQRCRRIAGGDPFALRLRSDGERVSFADRLLGDVSGVVDDFVVRRADGVVAYQLAVVVDDADQGIGEVVRGADLADSTPRQIVLARLLGLPFPAMPTFRSCSVPTAHGWPSATAPPRSPIAARPRPRRLPSSPTASGSRWDASGSPKRRICSGSLSPLGFPPNRW